MFGICVVQVCHAGGTPLPEEALAGLCLPLHILDLLQGEGGPAAALLIGGELLDPGNAQHQLVSARLCQLLHALQVGPGLPWLCQRKAGAAGNKGSHGAGWAQVRHAPPRLRGAGKQGRDWCQPKGMWVENSDGKDCWVQRGTSAGQVTLIQAVTWQGLGLHLGGGAHAVWHGHSERNLH